MDVILRLTLQLFLESVHLLYEVSDRSLLLPSWFVTVRGDELGLKFLYLLLENYNKESVRESVLADIHLDIQEILFYTTLCVSTQSLRVHDLEKAVCKLHVHVVN